MKTSEINRIVAATLLTLSAGAFVAGCGILAVGPDYKEPELASNDAPVPDAGYPTTNKTASGEFVPADTNADPRLEITCEDLMEWWKRFDDPILTDLVQEAISNNLSFLMAKERLTQARWRLLGSYAPNFPHLGFSGGAAATEYHRTTPTALSSGRDLHNDLFNGGFDATWEIDIFGGTRRSIESAAAAVEAADFQLSDVWVSLAAEIGSSYLNLRTVQERLVVARKNLKLQSETYDILKSRLDSGIGDELAVNQAKYNVEQTRASIPALLANEEALKNALAILTGTLPGALHAKLDELPSRDWLIEPRKLGNIPLEAMRSRPDVRAAERALASQVAAVGIAVSQVYPKFYINGQLGLQANKWDDFFHRSSLVGSIGPSFSWPLLQGGNMIANIRVEESKMNEKILAYELAVDTAYQESRNAYSAYTQQYHRYQSLEGAVKAAKDAEAISQDLYKNGLADFNNVLDAQRSLLTLEEQLTISRGQISLDLVSLYKALGGGFVEQKVK